MRKTKRGKGTVIGRIIKNVPMRIITTQLQLRLQISRLALCLNHIKETQRINWLGLAQFNLMVLWLSRPFSQC